MARIRFEWFLLLPGDDGNVGESVVPPTSCSRFSVGEQSFCVWSHQRDFVMAEALTVEEVSDRIQAWRGRLRQLAGAELDGAEGAARREGAGAGRGAQEPQDVRVLPVLFDTSDERWRTLEEAAVEYDGRL